MDLIDLTTEIDKRNSYARMFDRLGSCVCRNAFINSYSNKRDVCNKIHDDVVFDDSYLDVNIVSCRTDHAKAVEVYQNYVSKSETLEERQRRITRFRCGGW